MFPSQGAASDLRADVDAGGGAARSGAPGGDAKARAAGSATATASAASASATACATHVQRRRKNAIFISSSAHADVLHAGGDESAPPRVSVFASDLNGELLHHKWGSDGASSSGARSRGGGDEFARAPHVADRRSGGEFILFAVTFAI